MTTGRQWEYLQRRLGRPLYVEACPRTILALDGIMRQAGIRNFGAVEVTKVRWPDKLTEAERDALPSHNGQPIFLPIPYWYQRGVCVLITLQDSRDLIGAPIYCRNWWRPGDELANTRDGGYNGRVSTAKASDHLGAHAFDVKIDRRDHVEQILAEILEPMWLSGETEMSLGISSSVLHVGMFAGRGPFRVWSYDDWGEQWVARLKVKRR